METVFALASAGALALIMSSAITPLVLRISRRRSWYDMPSDRKIHASPIPRLGGIGIFTAFLVGALAVPLLLPLVRANQWPVVYGWRNALVFVAFCVIFGLGLVDDFTNLAAPFKFILQIFAAALVTVGGFTIAVVWIPFLGDLPLGLFAFPVTVIWIVGISNAMNLVDGIDGLAGGIAGLSALSLGVMSILQGHATPALVAFTLLGAVLGFLFFNLPPARIFMGDSGSLLLGFILAVIPLLGAPGGTSPRDMLAPITILSIPIIDTATAIARRLRERRAIHSPDKEHIHHKLLALGLKDTKILLIVYGFCAYFGAAALASITLRRTPANLLLAAVWLVSLFCYWLLHRRAKMQRNRLERP